MMLAGGLMSVMTAFAAPVLSRMVVTTRGGDTFLFPLTAQLKLRTDGSTLHISSADGSADLRVANVANIRYALEQEPVMLPGAIEKPLPPVDPFPWPGDADGDSSEDIAAGVTAPVNEVSEACMTASGLEVSAPGDSFVDIASLDGRTLYSCGFRDSVSIPRTALQSGCVVVTVNGRNSFKIVIK